MLPWICGGMIEKGYGNVTFGSEERFGRESFLNVKRVNVARSEVERRRRIEFYRGIWRRQIGMKKRGEFRERVRSETWWKTRRAAKMLEVWVKRLGLQVMMVLR